MVCKVCHNVQDNKIHLVQERVLNNGKVFRYLECGRCKSWMMIDNVELSECYPSNYNPYEKESQNGCIDKIRNKILFEIIIRLKHRVFPQVLQIEKFDILLKRMCGTRIKKNARILDVGCANGIWLDEIYNMGWKNITGVDLYIPEEKMRHKKWRFVSGEIFDLYHEKYDFISLNHSFEHMENPLSVLKKINDLLTDNGLCMISIPLVGGDAYVEFKEYYCQLDAPRHLYVLSKKAMRYLCRKAGLHIEYISYDSNEGIYELSEGYRKTNLSHGDLIRKPCISSRKREEYKKRAYQSNITGKGDQAIFYIRKNI